jgi:hypothetical protein
MRSITVYCSVEFLETLYSKIESPISEWIENDGIDNLKNLYELIHNNSKIVLDKDIDTRNPNFKRLYKKDKIPKTDPEVFNKIRNLNADFAVNLDARSILLTDFSDEIASSIKEQFGMMAFTSTGIEDTGILFTYGLEPFVKGNERSWSLIKKYEHPFNSLVLSDGYILSSKEARANLKALLKSILPSRLKITFDLTIIFQRNEKGLPAANLTPTFEEIIDHLSQEFKYPINLTLLESEEHDRNFITNYFWFSSGHGFELIRDEKTNKNTHVTVFPICNKILLKSGYFETLRERFRNLNLNTNAQSGLYTKVLGNRRNRLLE